MAKRASAGIVKRNSAAKRAQTAFHDRHRRENHNLDFIAIVLPSDPLIDIGPDQVLRHSFGASGYRVQCPGSWNSNSPGPDTRAIQSDSVPQSGRSRLAESNGQAELDDVGEAVERGCGGGDGGGEMRPRWASIGV